MNRLQLLSIIALLGITLAAVYALGGNGTRKTELFPQNQDCQAGSLAIRWQFPYQRSEYPQRYVPDPNAPARSITNCRRVGFQYFFETLEPTLLHFGLQSKDKFYGMNGNGNRDLIVHVSHVQPAISLSDPTISTNLYLLTRASEIQSAYARFDGTRDQAANGNFDYFHPYVHRASFKRYFLSKENAQPEFVGICNDTTCEVLVYSRQDGLVFTLTFPHGEVKRLDGIVDRTLTLLRQWTQSTSSSGVLIWDYAWRSHG